MKIFNFKYICLLALLVALTGCSNIFETSADVQARQALWDLMKVQEKYHQDNKRYARNLVQIKDYNLKYHTGIVYLEIEAADQEKYRAVALPAESTTARVFAYDTDKGGFYEMDEEEVSEYVLGALKHIREKRGKEDLNDLLTLFLLGGFILLGVRFTGSYGDRAHRPVLYSFFLSIFSLGWALALLNHFDKNIVFSTLMMAFTCASLLVAVISLALAFRWLRTVSEKPEALIGMMVCTVIISLFSAGVMANTLFHQFSG